MIQSPSERLKDTLARIGSRVDAYKAEEREKTLALAWCRAYGDPHKGKKS